MSKKILYRDIKQLRNKQPAEYALIKEQKDLTPLKALKRIRQETIPATYNQDFDKEECCKIIETALKDYEEIINTGWKNIPTNLQFLDKILDEYLPNSDTLKDLEKSLKVLKIIKNTRVDTNIIKESKDYDDYCGLEAQKMLTLMFSAPKQIGITEEQYDLLKEVLL